jgi:hypothetical protein
VAYGASPRAANGPLAMFGRALLIFQNLGERIGPGRAGAVREQCAGSAGAVREQPRGGTRMREQCAGALRERGESTRAGASRACAGRRGQARAGRASGENQCGQARAGVSRDEFNPVLVSVGDVVLSFSGDWGNSRGIRDVGRDLTTRSVRWRGRRGLTRKIRARG